MKPMDPDDCPLTLGGAFYANEDDFDTFQTERPRDKKDVRAAVPEVHLLMVHTGDNLQQVRRNGILPIPRPCNRDRRSLMCVARSGSATGCGRHRPRRGISALDVVGQPGLTARADSRSVISCNAAR